MATQAKAKAVKKTAPKLVEKTYQLTKYHPLTFTLKTGADNNLLIFDEKLETQRAIKHAPNERTIFVDEQSKLAVAKPLIFKDGFLYTKKEETLTQQFLDMHPSNGKLFEVLDAAADAEDMIEYEETILDIKLAIQSKVKEEGGIEELRALVGVLKSDISLAAKMTVPELKYAAYEVVNSNPERFLDEDDNITIFEDVAIKRQAIAQHAFVSGTIEVAPDSSKIMWADNKSIICYIPTGRNYLEYFAEHLGSEEGIQVAGELSKRNK